MKYILKMIFFLFLFLNTPLFATIDNTKHNLSISGPGSIKAQAETEVCVFCHIPHRAQAEGKPLWNRSMPVSAYDMYNSDYLKRMGYAVEADLGATKGTPGALSRQCLSCHDGTVAVGAVHALRTATDQLIDMNGVEIADGTMPSAAAGFIGTDLTMHHPVGIIYNPALTKSFGVGTKTMELKTSPDSPIKVFNYAGNNYVECSSCHDPHKDNDKFLLVDAGANFAQKVSTTCTSCHEKIDWLGSVHQTPPVGSPDYTDAQLLVKYATGEISDMGCANCHTPHNAGGIPYLNRQVQEQTCFQGAASDTIGAACHGDNAGAAVNIETVANRTYAHPIISANNPNGSHTNLDVLYGADVPLDPDGGKGVSWDNNRHATCMDCHNPHKAQKGTHTDVVDASGWYPVAPNANTNDVSPVLVGVTGVEPTWPVSGWEQPTTFTTLESATKEYQICMKCHSYWGLGSATFGASSFFLSAEGTIVTDQAWEFNPKNRSAHPVVMTTNEMIASGGDRYAYPQHTITMLPPWNTNVGNQTMYCSDCHGADDENTIDPKGPHGSSKKYMLKGQYKDWPENSATGQPWHIGDALDAGGYNLPVPGEIFCLNCHTIERVAGNDAINGAHRIKSTMESMITPGTYVKCINCHVAVPHGSPVSRLIGYYNFPEPYNYNGNSLMLTGYRSNYTAVDTPVYNWGDAYLVDHDGLTPGYPAIDTVPTCGGNGSAFCHGTDGGGYDPWIIIP